MAKNKKMAPAAAQAAPAAQPTGPVVKFDVWYAMREKRIPGHHHKEILKADFRGRGLKDFETVDAFDKALSKYGVSL